MPTLFLPNTIRSEKLVSKNAIQSNAGNFPLTAQLTAIDSFTNVITGVYQSNNGVKGIYFSKIEREKNHSYKVL